MDFIEHLTKFQVTSYVGIEDFADKINFQFTVIILLFCTSVATVKQYGFKPISCFLSSKFDGNNIVSFVENYCWVQGTVPFHSNATLPTTTKQWNELESSKILYYQWVPFALGLQCIMFYLPRLLWQITCYSQLGTDLQHLLTSANQAVHASSEDAGGKLIAYVARTIAHACYQHREYRTKPPSQTLHSLCPSNLRGKINIPLISKRSGTRTIFFYMMHKVLYVINSCLQLYFMHIFLGSNKYEGNKNVFSILISSIYHGRIWKDTLLFPRNVFCRTPIYNVGTLNYVVSQCVLPNNMLNEKIYLFLYIWVIFCITINVASIPIWSVRIFGEQYHLIVRYLKLKDVIKRDDSNTDEDIKSPLTPNESSFNNENRNNSVGSFKLESTVLMQQIKVFQQQFLRKDGVFLVKMITINCGDIVGADIVYQLWKIYKNTYYSKLLFPKTTHRRAALSSRNGMLPGHLVNRKRSDGVFFQ